MKRIALVLAVLAALIFIALGAYLVFSRNVEQQPASGPQTTNPFGFANSTSTVSSSERTLALVTDEGGRVYVPDFTQTEQPDWAGPDAGYNVVGDGTGSYAITFYPSDSENTQAQFSIALLAEPLGESRLLAERALREQTGLTDAELCSLDVQVFTSIHVSDVYAGYDLGLSTCPGATALP